MTKPKARCVNIDWLEVYALEDNTRYPMNADYFRSHGYFVNEREYGTRVFSEMFTVEDGSGNNFVEVRRNPQSGDSSFSGLSELSVHLRLVNRACYSNTAVRDLAEFMILHGYIFQKIFRIDVCYDFTEFDSGDNPERFIRRYIEKKFSKVNQCHVSVFGSDSWASFDWESVSWGARTSMVNTKMYNKTKEMAASGYKKPWIVQAWFESGLIDDPLKLPDVWRIEFSLKSSARNWLVIEDSDAKTSRKKAIPHSLPLFDGRDKLWQRFEELAYHYFRFKYVEYKDSVNSQNEREMKRKDLCRDKRLFNFNRDRVFYSVQGVAKQDYLGDKDRVLRNQLEKYRESHANLQIRKAIDILLQELNRTQLRKVTANGTAEEIEQLIIAIRTRTGWDYHKSLEIATEVQKLIIEKEIW